MIARLSEVSILFDRLTGSSTLCSNPANDSNGWLIGTHPAQQAVDYLLSLFIPFYISL